MKTYIMFKQYKTLKKKKKGFSVGVEYRLLYSPLYFGISITLPDKSRTFQIHWMCLDMAESVQETIDFPIKHLQTLSMDVLSD